MKGYCKSLFLACLIIYVPGAYAGYAISATEAVLLPKFCRQLSEGNYEGDAKKYRIPGTPSGMPHLQHFCHGLKDIVRADRARSERERRESLSSAVGEFNYVIGHTQDVIRYSSYMAMVKVKRADVMVRLGSGAEAIADYMEAIRLQPKYSGPYVGLCDYYQEIGDLDAARRIVAEGLKQVPKSKALQRRSGELFSH